MSPETAWTFGDGVIVVCCVVGLLFATRVWNAKPQGKKSEPVTEKSQGMATKPEAVGA